MVSDNNGFAGRLGRLEKILNPDAQEEAPGYIVLTASEWEIIKDETISDSEKMLIYDRHGLDHRRRYKVYVRISPEDWDE